MPFHHFHHFYQDLQQGTDWPTIFIGFAGAILGALIGGVATWLATNNQIREERRRQAEETNAKVNAILSALYHELKTVWPIYMNNIGGMLETWPVDKPFVVTISTIDNYYVIYESNTQNIGLIPKPHLRDKIISTYTALKALRGIWKYHNEYLETMNVAGEQFFHARTEASRDILLNKEPVLKDIFTKLKAHHIQTKEQVADLIRELEPYSQA